MSTIRQGETATATVAGVNNREIAVGVACLLDKNHANPLEPFRGLKPMLTDRIVTEFGLLPMDADPDAFKAVALGPDAPEEAQRYRQFSGGFGLNLFNSKTV